MPTKSAPKRRASVTKSTELELGNEGCSLTITATRTDGRLNITFRAHEPATGYGREETLSNTVTGGISVEDARELAALLHELGLSPPLPGQRPDA